MKYRTTFTLAKNKYFENIRNVPYRENRGEFSDRPNRCYPSSHQKIIFMKTTVIIVTKILIFSQVDIIINLNFEDRQYNQYKNFKGNIPMEHPVGRMDPTKKIHPITIGVTISDTKNIITRIDSNLIRDIKDINSRKIMRE